MERYRKRGLRYLALLSSSAVTHFRCRADSGGLETLQSGSRPDLSMRTDLVWIAVNLRMVEQDDHGGAAVIQVI